MDDELKPQREFIPWLGLVSWLKRRERFYGIMEVDLGHADLEQGARAARRMRDALGPGFFVEARFDEHAKTAWLEVMKIAEPVDG